MFPSYYDDRATDRIRLCDVVYEYVFCSIRTSFAALVEKCSVKEKNVECLENSDKFFHPKNARKFYSVRRDVQQVYT